MDKITSFKGKYRFLSNFWPVTIVGPGNLVYLTVEHAYVASKSLDPDLWSKAQKIDTPGKVKHLGRKIEIRPDWDAVKLAFMRDYVTQKFQNPELKRMLDDTRGRELIEGNSWGDIFWGQCPIGKGQNHLGKILMCIRDNPFTNT